MRRLSVVAGEADYNRKHGQANFPRQHRTKRYRAGVDGGIQSRQPAHTNSRSTGQDGCANINPVGRAIGRANRVNHHHTKHR